MTKKRHTPADTRKRAVEAVVRGVPPTDVAHAYGVDRSTLSRWVARFAAEGERGLLRRPGCGHPPSLTKALGRRFWEILLQPASNFGYDTDLWTAWRVCEVIRAKLGVTAWAQTIRRELCEAGLMNGRLHYGSLVEKRNAHPTWMEWGLVRIRKSVHTHKALLYFLDKVRVSPPPVPSDGGAPLLGPSEMATGDEHEPLGALRAVGSRTRLLFIVHEEPIVSKEVCHFLDQLLHLHLKRHLVVVMDEALPHAAKEMASFMARCPRLHLFSLSMNHVDGTSEESQDRHAPPRWLRFR